MKVAILVLADSESHADMGRIANALEATKEFTEEGDDIQLIFDGAGTTWIPKLTDESNDLHPLYQAVKQNVKGACSFCAQAFGAKEQIEETDVSLISEYDDHPSIRKLVKNGYQVITF